eukprot:7158605-Prymnesium_polylepis.2
MRQRYETGHYHPPRSPEDTAPRAPVPTYVTEQLDWTKGGRGAGGVLDCERYPRRTQLCAQY